MDHRAPEGDPVPIESLSDEALLALLDDSDLEFEEDDDEESQEVDNLRLQVANEDSRCQSPENSDVPLDLRLGNEKLPKEKRKYIWKVKNWETHPLPESNPETGELLNPSQYYERYIGDDLFELMATETNKYYLMTKGKLLNTSPSELKKFVGMLLIMGTISYPRLRYYWDRKFQMPAVSNTMTRDRFFSLRVNLHFVDNNMITENEKKENRLWKVQPVVDSVKNRCLQLPRTATDYSVDEQMIPFLGACPARQYVKNKPRPVGLKNFVCTTSGGVVVDFEIYQGNQTPWRDTGLGLGANSVLHVTKTLPPRSRIFFNRFFTSIPLLDALQEKELFGTGTVMSNRLGKNFHVKKDSEMFRGEAVQKVRSDDSVCVVKWMDNKGVLMASNLYGKEPAHEVKRWDKKQKKYSEVACPNVVKKYNEKMGGVDVCDQLMEAYRTFFRTKKWTLKVAIHFFDLAAVNAWLEYRADARANGLAKKEILDLMKFRLALGEKLTSSPKGKRFVEEEGDEEEANPTKKLCVTPLPCLEKRIDCFDHFPVVDDLANARCCRMKGCSSRSRVRCTKCNIYLCLTNKNSCFKDFHTK